MAYALSDEMEINDLGWPWRPLCATVAKWCEIGCCCCCFFLALNQRSYVTGLGEASIPQVIECYLRFVEKKSDDEVILIEMVAACIFQYWTFSHEVYQHLLCLATSLTCGQFRLVLVSRYFVAVPCQLVYVLLYGGVKAESFVKV